MSIAVPVSIQYAVRLQTSIEETPAELVQTKCMIDQLTVGNKKSNENHADVETEKFLFLESSWEQYTAGKNTLRDFVFIAALSSRRPVMPFVGQGGSAFVGHPDGSGSTGQPLDQVLAFDLPIMHWETFDNAYKSCSNRLRFATLVHQSDGATCSKFLASNSRGIARTMKQWNARENDCLETMNLDVQYFENSTDCIVLYRFRGLHHGRGHLAWEHSQNATRKHDLWNERDNLLRSEYAHIQQSSDIAPSRDFLISSAECNNNLWGNLFDVLQYRGEYVCINLNKGELQSLQDNMTLFTENCVHNTIEELEHLRDTDSKVPILLLHDMGKQGSKTAKNPCRSIFPASRLADIVKSRFPGVPVHYSTECNVFEQCQGPTCFLLDMAIFLQARHAVQLGEGSSSTEIRLPRNHAGRNTTTLQLTSYENVTCPYQITVT